VSDQVAFLSARLDEREAAAKATQLRFPGPWDRAVAPDSPLPSALSLYDSHDESFGVIRGSYAADHIVLHDPARTLREVEADRDLLDLYDRAARYRDRVFAQPEPRSVSDEMRAVTQMMALEQVLRLRAAVYSDRPDYRQEWKS